MVWSWQSETTAVEGQRCMKTWQKFKLYTMTSQFLPSDQKRKVSHLSQWTWKHYNIKKFKSSNKSTMCCTSSTHLQPQSHDSCHPGLCWSPRSPPSLLSWTHPLASCHPPCSPTARRKSHMCSYEGIRRGVWQKYVITAIRSVTFPFHLFFHFSGFTKSFILYIYFISPYYTFSTSKGWGF